MRVLSVNISDKKGIRKRPVGEIIVEENFGILGDAHASSAWHRQISLLGIESIEKLRKKGLQVGPGDFAENITTEGIELLSLPVGTRLRIGNVILVVSQIGKECHTKCAIFRQRGDCVMPKEGIFVKVLKGGTIRPGDVIEVQNDKDRHTHNE